MDSLPGERVTAETARRFGEWLRRRMRQAGMSQTELFRKSGVKPAYLSRIANGGGTNPTVNQIAALADAFDTDPNEIFAAAGWWEPPGKDQVQTRPRIPEEFLGLIEEMSPGQREMALRVLRAMVAAPIGDYRERPAAYDRDVAPEDEDGEDDRDLDEEGEGP